MIPKLQYWLKTIAALGPKSGLSFIINRRRKNLQAIHLTDSPFTVQHPITLRPDTSDVDVFVQVFIEKEYNIDFGFEPKVIIDGGANIGLASIYFKNRFPKATLISIEPDEENVEVLKTNLANYPDVHIRQASLWSKKAQTRLVDKYDLGKWAMITEEVDPEETTDTTGSSNTLTMDDVMAEFGLDYIDMLKLDIESAEVQLFTDNYMSWLPKTKVIIIELHDWMTEGCSKPFFLAINNAFSTYHFSQAGENTVIINRDLLPK